MDWILLGLLPVIAALIGWLTNWLAIQMLFRPREPLSVLGVRFQGLIPRRHEAIATKVGEIVQRDLLTQHVLQEQVRKIDLSPYVDGYADRLVHERLAPRLRAIPLLGRLVSDSVLETVARHAREEMAREAPAMLERFAVEAEQHLDVRRLVEARVRVFELETLERIARQLAGREFRQIEILGGVLGFLIGLVQVAITLLAARL